MVLVAFHTNGDLYKLQVVYMVHSKKK